MSFNAFYFTMTEAQMKEAFQIPKEEVGSYLQNLYWAADKSADSRFWGYELARIIEEADSTIPLSSAYRGKGFPEFAKLLEDTIGNGYYFDVKGIRRAVDNLPQVDTIASDPDGYEGTFHEITATLKKEGKEFLFDEIVEVLCDIAEVFVYAKENNCIVVNFWG